MHVEYQYILLCKELSMTTSTNGILQGCILLENNLTAILLCAKAISIDFISLLQISIYPGKTGHQPNVESMLVQRLRRRPKIDPTLS